MDIGENGSDRFEIMSVGYYIKAKLTAFFEAAEERAKSAISKAEAHYRALAEFQLCSFGAYEREDEVASLWRQFRQDFVGLEKKSARLRAELDQNDKFIPCPMKRKGCCVKTQRILMQNDDDVLTEKGILDDGSINFHQARKTKEFEEKAKIFEEELERRQTLLQNKRNSLKRKKGQEVENDYQTAVHYVIEKILSKVEINFSELRDLLKDFQEGLQNTQKNCEEQRALLERQIKNYHARNENVENENSNIV
ncbi:17898_t:CDS:10 [Funneliformis geosporum]|nr:17898_t:CDS:10 [Funneliformis geosporum]